MGHQHTGRQVVRHPAWCWYSVLLTCMLVVYGIECARIVGQLLREYGEIMR